MNIYEKLISSLSMKELELVEQYVLKEKVKRLENNIFISTIDMSPRLNNTLKRAGIETLNQLTELNKNSIRSFKGFGWKSIQELENIMLEYNLKFK